VRDGQSRRAARVGCHAARSQGGAVHRIGYSSTNAPPHAAFTATPTAGEPPLTVTFDARVSFDADPGDQLTYGWDLDGDGELDAAGPTATTTYDTIGARTVRLTVIDKAGATDGAETTIRVGTDPRVPAIDTPADGATLARTQPDALHQRMRGRGRSVRRQLAVVAGGQRCLLGH
jgi:PKD repeat protein